MLFPAFFNSSNEPITVSNTTLSLAIKMNDRNICGL